MVDNKNIYEIKTDGDRYWIQLTCWLEGFWPWSKPEKWNYWWVEGERFVGIPYADKPLYFYSLEIVEKVLDRIINGAKTVKTVSK